MKLYIYSADSLNAKQRTKIANYSTDPEELRELSNDRAESVRHGVMMNPDAPKDVRDRIGRELVTSRHVGSREGAFHYALYMSNDKDYAESMLYRFSDDPSPKLRQRVASFCENYPDLQEKLVNDPSVEVRRQLAWCATEPDVIDQLLNDEDASVRWAAASDPEHKPEKRTRSVLGLV